MTTVYLNGEFIPKERAMISVEDRGFIFGDGIYEVVARDRRAALRMGLRTPRGCATGSRACASCSASRIHRRAQGRARTARSSTMASAKARPSSTCKFRAASAPRTHSFPPAKTPPTVFAAASRFVVPREQREQGVKAVTFPGLPLAAPRLENGEPPRQRARAAGRTRKRRV